MNTRGNAAALLAQPRPLARRDYRAGPSRRPDDRTRWGRMRGRVHSAMPTVGSRSSKWLCRCRLSIGPTLAVVELFGPSPCIPGRGGSAMDRIRRAHGPRGFGLVEVCVETFSPSECTAACASCAVIAGVELWLEARSLRVDCRPTATRTTTTKTSSRTSGSILFVILFPPGTLNRNAAIRPKSTGGSEKR